MFNQKEYAKKYREKNKERIKKEKREYCQNNKEKIREYKIKYNKEHKKEIREWANEYQKGWRLKNPENGKKYKKKWYLENKEKVKEYYSKNKERINMLIRERRRTNFKFRLNENVSRGIHQALKGNKAGRHWETLVGYTVQELIEHLEALFEPWMNWDNWGKGKGKWNIDHKTPKTWFNFKTAEDIEFKDCWALNNLQPLDAIENIRKNNRYKS